MAGNRARLVSPSSAPVIPVEPAGPQGARSVGDFELEAFVDGHVVRAKCDHGRLSADECLLDRARLLVSIGETFGDSSYNLRAGLDDPLRAALTLVRAADRITKFRLDLDGIAVTYSP